MAFRQHCWKASPCCLRIENRDPALRADVAWLGCEVIIIIVIIAIRIIIIVIIAIRIIVIVR